MPVRERRTSTQNILDDGHVGVPVDGYRVTGRWMRLHRKLCDVVQPTTFWYSRQMCGMEELPKITDPEISDDVTTGRKRSGALHGLLAKGRVMERARPDRLHGFA